MTPTMMYASSAPAGPPWARLAPEPTKRPVPIVLQEVRSRVKTSALCGQYRCKWFLAYPPRAIIAVEGERQGYRVSLTG
jgi:hypothetical protein